MRRFLAALIVLVGVASCEGCQHNPAPTPVTPPGAVDAASTWDGSTPATCLDLCRHEQALGCPAAQDTPAGATYVDVYAVSNQAIPFAAYGPRLPDARTELPEGRRLQMSIDEPIVSTVVMVRGERTTVTAKSIGRPTRIGGKAVGAEVEVVETGRTIVHPEDPQGLAGER